jgi:hypothetical protein
LNFSSVNVAPYFGVDLLHLLKDRRRRRDDGMLCNQAASGKADDSRWQTVSDGPVASLKNVTEGGELLGNVAS